MTPGKDAGRYILLLSLGVAVVLLCITKYSDYDLWWHLKLGETISESLRIYTHDQFSYTFSGQPQANAEWLSDLIIFGFYLAGGMTGITVFKALILLAAFWFLFLAARTVCEGEEAGFYASVVTLVLILFSLRFRLFVRPFLFSFLFFAVFLWLSGKYQRTSEKRFLYPLPLLEMLWANLSLGAVFGPFVVAALLCNELLQRRQVRPLFIIFVLTVLASMINPQTYRIYSIPFMLLLNNPYRMVIGEHQPVTAEMLFGYGLRYTVFYQVLAVGSLVYLLLQKGWKNMFHLLLGAGFLCLSLLQVRMIDFFSLMSAVLFVRPVEKVFSFVSSLFALQRRLVSFGLAGLLVALAVFVSLSSRTYAFGTGIKADTFPEEALTFLEREGVTGRMFNSYAFGGYIIWRAPQRKVFIDGRSTRLYAPEFANAYLDSLSDAGVWNSLQEQWEFDYAVLDYDMKDRRFPLHLNTNPQWVPVYWDNHSAVYLRNTPGNAELIKKHGYKITRPNFYDYSYLQSQAGSSPGELIAQLDREISLNPSNKEPLLAKAFLLYNLGKPYQAEVLKTINASIKLNPPLAMEHSALGFFLADMGMKDKARQEMAIALSLDPSDPGALALRDRLR